jgi:hypothetical protein
VIFVVIARNNIPARFDDRLNPNTVCINSKAQMVISVTKGKTQKLPENF